MPRAVNFILIAAALALFSAPHTVAAQKPDAQASATEKFERGRRLFEQGDFEAAIPLLRAAAEMRKKDAGAWFFYGLALSRTDKAKDARKAFEKSLKLQPDDAGARTGLAYSLLQLNKLRDAEREAKRALILDQRNAEAHYVVGAIRFRENKFAEAAEEAEAALSIKPDLPAAAFLAGDALLNAYADESTRQAEKYPLTPGAGEDERKAVFEKRDVALVPFKARMRSLSERLEVLVGSQPNRPDAEDLREMAGSLKLYGSARRDASGVFLAADLPTKALITYKPEPGYTEEARRNNVTGVVRLRAVLAADGQVRHILVIKRLPNGLTERAVAAARQIKFKPAMINGQPVAQFVILEYNFNIY